jgi:hypothetical protein
MELALKAKAPGADTVDRDKARRVAQEARGIPVPVSAGSPDLAAILKTASRVPSHPPWTLADSHPPVSGKDDNHPVGYFDGL